ncbi:MAG: hypothetical protein ACK5QX_11260 [bacterium]|jgi:hypothetical protein
MGVISYIPKKKEVIDNRSNEGGYYTAVCDECGNDFFPKRSNAMYCSRSCLVMAYRKKKSLLPQKPIKKTVNESLILEKTLSGADMAWYLKANYSVDTEKTPIYVLKDILKAIEIGEMKQFNTISVKRHSPNKYQLYRQS